jgi:hypothetical protein
MACVDLLKRVRHIAHRCGGSLAQCHLIHLTFAEAALRARRARLARALVAERTARKPASLLNSAFLPLEGQPTWAGRGCEDPALAVASAT